MKETAQLSTARIQSFYLFLFTLFFLAPMPCTAGEAQKQSLHDLPIEGRNAVSASIGHDRPAYHARFDRAGVQADNAGHGLTAHFGSAGVEMGAGGTRFALRPFAWGYGPELEALRAGTTQALDNMVVLERGAVGEWYVNGPLGLQQGFTVPRPPQGGGGPLTIALALEGVRPGPVDSDGRGVALSGAGGGFRYGGLVVRDAAGSLAQAWLEANETNLRICVNDTGLAYPLYIDPVIQKAKLTAADGEANDYFGRSVAISGETVVVGVDFDDIGANSNQGSAYVFVRPESGWADMTQTAKLTASGGAASDYFGYSVAISGDTVVAGSSNADIGANADQGSAYVFVRPESGWADMTQTAKLTASDGAASDYWGISVAVSGDTVVVGSAYDGVGPKGN